MQRAPKPRDPVSNIGRALLLAASAVILMVASVADVGAANARAPIDQVSSQWSTPASPTKVALDFTPFAAAIASLTPAISARIGDVADNGSLSEIAYARDAGLFTSEQLVTWYLARIQRYDSVRYNSVIELNPDALTIARASDARRSSGGSLGPLEGMPLLLKANISTGDAMHTAAGAAALAGLRPGRDAFIAGELRQAGAVLLGKANLSEWANEMTSTSVNGYSALGGYTRNPYGRFDVLGSSSGSAVATAASFAAATVGTETNGSIIRPSQANNVVGLKPTLGLVSRDLIIPITDEQDTAGPMARSVADVAVLLTALTAQQDPGDRYHRVGTPLAGHDFAADARQSASGLRVGVFDPVPGANSVRALQRRYRGTGIVFVPLTVTDVLSAATGTDAAPDENSLLVAGMAHGVDRYLRLVGATGTASSLASVVEYNRQDLTTRAPYGQDLLVKATHDTTSVAAWRRSAAKARAIQQKAIRAILRAHHLDAVSGLPLAFDYAIAGFPAITVPLSSKTGSEPAFLALTGDALSEPILLRLAAAIERVEGPRRAPILSDVDPLAR
jgi:amidase